MKAKSRLSLLLLALGLIPQADAAPQYFEFRGTITNSASYNLNVPTSSLKAVLGSTPVTYWFVVDFAQSWITSNTAGTWTNFYTDLLGQGLMESEIGATGDEVHSGFNWDANYIADVGQVTGGRSVRITTRASSTLDWKVQDWAVGDRFELVDGALPPIDFGGVYYYGQVTLVSISSVVPEPSALALFLTGVIALAARRLRC